MGQIKNIKLHIVTDIKATKRQQQHHNNNNNNNNNNTKNNNNNNNNNNNTTMSKTNPPELKKYMDRKLSLKLNGNRNVTGILRGFDPFMNLVMDDCVEVVNAQTKNVIRGNSVLLMEALERI